MLGADLYIQLSQLRYSRLRWCIQYGTLPPSFGLTARKVSNGNATSDNRSSEEQPGFPVMAS